ncbi:helix-turn-helix domain-containing protein [Mangrovicoccus ximenensis]|uniref:helix-turn-helix domain-containing protein n=1 Tax=Mangrovicoccus ximenensis TaxID=1911570 RepID=UPI000D37E008|nr:helix-turn-helix transcriptional regulator [Mangrovicoccus ximenensis]
MPANTTVALAFDLRDPADRQQYLHVLLARAGITMTELAEELGVGRTMVSQVIGSQRVSGKIRADIAARLGQDVRLLWPAEAQSGEDRDTPKQRLK